MRGRTTATIVRTVTTEDRYGDQQPSLEPTRITVRGCQFAPRSSNDITAPGRQGVLVGYSLYAPAGTDIAAGDRVEVDGVLYEIEGLPGHWAKPSSQRGAGIEIALRQAIG